MQPGQQSGPQELDHGPQQIATLAEEVKGKGDY